MSTPIIEILNISKRYRLGQFGMSSFREESEKWLQKLRGKAPKDNSDSSNRDFWALRDVSFSVQPGEVVGIIGRNGAGKSTLLKILSRITEPTSGEVILRGKVASLLEVGTGFHPELSGRDNIFLNGAILGMKRAEIAAKFDEIVAFAEIDTFVDTPVKRYSSGMYVKLAFAVAAHLEPDILIVDEVLAVGDAAFQKKCVAKMGEVSGQGRTVLFVSHNVGLISELCRSAVLLEHGSIVYRGDVTKAIELYTNQTGASEQFTRPDTGNKTSGTGPHICSVKISNIEGGTLIHTSGGYNVHIEADRGVPYLGALIRIRNHTGLAVQYFNTAFQGDDDSCDNTSPSKFALAVPKAGLPPGHYVLDAELWLPEGRVDGVDGACRFEVNDGYFDGRQANLFVGKCTTLTPHRWNSEK